MKELEWLSGPKPVKGETFYRGGKKEKVVKIKGKKVVVA